MKVNIIQKNVSQNMEKLRPMVYEYRTDIHTVKEFLEETVRIRRKKYEEDIQRENCEQSETIEAKAANGKVTYGPVSHRKPLEEVEAIRNAVEAFVDGLVAVFLDGKRLEQLQDAINLREGSTAVFVALSALSADCYLLDWMW